MTVFLHIALDRAVELAAFAYANRPSAEPHVEAEVGPERGNLGARSRRRFGGSC